MFTDDDFTYFGPPYNDLQRNIYFRDKSNHSKIVANLFARNHSKIVGQNSNISINDSVHKSLTTFSVDNSMDELKFFGVFHNYPNGIVNPAFTGMMLWEVSCNHDLNDYQICEYHNIKSGIILYGTEAYVFTQITNNDIMSHIKILFRQSNLL